MLRSRVAATRWLLRVAFLTGLGVPLLTKAARVEDEHVEVEDASKDMLAVGERSRCEESCSYRDCRRKSQCSDCPHCKNRQSAKEPASEMAAAEEEEEGQAEDTGAEIPQYCRVESTQCSNPVEWAVLGKVQKFLCEDGGLYCEEIAHDMRKSNQYGAPSIQERSFHQTGNCNELVLEAGEALDSKCPGYSSQLWAYEQLVGKFNLVAKQCAQVLGGGAKDSRPDPGQ
eukprot:TRINITY_DN27445_c0_g1_i2.p1 TRINITY_DN27445_c0_g1~~TRINITY_DN27445_c0_g1_i2.p1  ORF type:complete len:228 (+),score=31.30 TRINITY_DN27445_c0_g1_i2:52-735(+)